MDQWRKAFCSYIIILIQYTGQAHFIRIWSSVIYAAVAACLFTRILKHWKAIKDAQWLYLVEFNIYANNFPSNCSVSF